MSTQFTKLICPARPTDADRSVVTDAVAAAWDWAKIEPVMSSDTEIGKTFWVDDRKYIRITGNSSEYLAVSYGTADGLSDKAITTSQYRVKFTVAYNSKCFVLAGYVPPNSNSNNSYAGAVLDASTRYLVVGSATNQTDQTTCTAIAHIFNYAAADYNISSACIIADDTAELRTAHSIGVNDIWNAQYTTTINVGSAFSAYQMDDFYYMPFCELGGFGNNVISELHGHKYRIMGWLAFDEGD